jgi:hypothetical protein
MEEENLVAVNSGRVDVTLLRPRGKTKGVKDLGDVLLPELSSLRVALESMQDREDLALVHSAVKLSMVPFGKSVITMDKSWDLGRECKKAS